MYILASEEEEEVKYLAKVVDEDINLAGDKYRSILLEEAENTEWRHGAPPIFDKVKKHFEEGRTKQDHQEWPKGSLEEAVQNAVK
ncbi:hypothetical protein FEM48_Zijuj12G0114800 [Ziziphus jujuba var. spinosa]|uniref:Pathogen-related protein n=1 Tax=Ziziphus jujuba var. spinosa TaxID=714518 RepID=A0A978UD20_ZIZJJ|nr:hypothetical protein FEM48_Zijuj12G0114800 [Ziziphus jujuba var. spinosa]